MPLHKKYSLNEVKSIIKVATQLESRQNISSDASFSIEDIREIAISSGISLQKIESALQFLESEDLNSPPSNSETIFSIEQFIEHQVTPEIWERIVRECRNYFGNLGQTNQFGNTCEWVGNTKNNTVIHISISSGKDISRLKLHVDYSSISNKIKIIASLVGFISFAIISSLLNLDSISNFVPLALNLTGAGLGYLSSTSILKGYLNKKSVFYTNFIEKATKLISSKFENKQILSDDSAFEEEERIFTKGQIRAQN